MNFRIDRTPEQPRWLLFSSLCLVAGLILYCLLRVRWIGHLLTWGEAMTL